MMHTNSPKMMASIMLATHAAACQPEMVHMRGLDEVQDQNRPTCDRERGEKEREMEVRYRVKINKINHILKNVECRVRN